MGAIADRAAELAATDPVAALRTGFRVFLEVVQQPGVQRISMIDAPVVLGWKQWRASAEEYGLALVEGMLAAAVAAGQIEERPIRPMAVVAIGAVDEAAFYIADADDPDRATAEMLGVLDRIIDAFVRPGGR
ncbi:MAG: hypothetical protein QM662_15610 [Gordonia sp. (in: high G+C Gram-positive bacteria)]